MFLFFTLVWEYKSCQESEDFFDNVRLRKMEAWEKGQAAEHTALCVGAAASVSHSRSSVTRSSRALEGILRVWAERLAVN